MKFLPQLWISVFLAVASAPSASAATLPGVDASELPEPVRRPVKYFGDIHPVLAQHCVECHGADKQKGGLRLDSLEAALIGGSGYGPAIVPGKSEESPLLLFAAHLEPDMEMPPKGDMLSEDTLAVLRAWIDQGAKWPAPAGKSDGESILGNQPLFFEKAKTHWSFQPVPKAKPASLEHGSTTIDAFIEERLAAKGLDRSPRADGRTLLKRLHFDLTGLPPSHEELEQFTAAFDKNPGAALAAKADELLASPHFGERWGRYWLDMARYADTRDFQAQADLRYPYAWTYRDYVVEAFNSDKPYDRFILEQIAADQLELEPNDPSLAALGYLTVGPRFRNRIDEIHNDRIDVVTRGLMAMTVSCARCHDHKYDPIPTADFYALQGIFASTEDLEAMPEITLAGAEMSPKLRKEYEAAKAAAEQAKVDFVADLKEEAVADVLSKPELYFDGLVQMEVTKTADVRKLISGKKMMETALTPLSVQWNALKRDEAWRVSPVFAPLARVVGASPDRKSAFLQQLIAAGRVPGVDVPIHPAVLQALQTEKPADEAALVRLYGKLLGQAQSASDESLKPILAAFTGEGGLLDFRPNSVEGAYRLLGTGRRDLGDLDKAITEVEATHPGAPARAMAVQDKAKPVQPVIYVRGEPTRKGDAVDRRFLEVLDPAKTPFPAGQSGRLELAKRIASTDNPLTPRVWANHVWRHLLGQPLAATPGDFGLQSGPPSHPELLDWLASALMERDWSTKKLVRDIVLSSTYQQASVNREEAVSVDPGNQLLWRAERRRMDFEAMRDAMLATSGKLEPTLGGRAENLSAEPFSGRRTIYGLVDRTNLDPLFTTFDFPSPDLASTERSETLVPQQALFALNDAFIIDQARALARAAQQSALSNLAEGANPGAAAIEELYRRVFLRPPAPEEDQLARAFLRETSGLRNESFEGSWIHGSGDANPATPRASAFQPLPYFDPQRKRYQGGRPYPHPQRGFAHLSASGGHPGPGLETAAIRRWVAPYDGTFAIQGEVSVVRQNNGDGVRARLISSRSGLIGEWIADGGPVLTEVENVTLERGEILDFAVDSRDQGSSDAFRWAPTIRLVVRPEDAPTGVATVWDAQANFQAPLPPKLQPLEQVAHALLMTNEFLFID